MTPTQLHDEVHPSVAAQRPSTTVYVWAENGTYRFTTTEGDVWMDGLDTATNAVRMVEDQVGMGRTIIYERPPRSVLKNRLQSGYISAPVSDTTEDKGSAPAPLQSDPSTIPANDPEHYQIRITADLFPLLKSAVEKEADRIISRIETEQGTKDLLAYERKAVIESNRSRLSQLHALMEQLPQ